MRAIILSSFLFAAFVGFSQCTSNDRLYLPIADHAKFDGYGSSIDIYQDVMVVGAPLSDSLQVEAGLAYVYKLNSSNQWEKIAILAPATHLKQIEFGTRVSIDANTIVISGVYYEDDGSATNRLHVFDIPGSGQWQSATESYQIVGTPSFGNFELFQNELIAIANNNNVRELRIYKKVGGVFSLDQAIEAPLGLNGFDGGFGRLAVDTDLIAVGVEQFGNDDGTAGVTFLYERTGAQYNPVPYRLRPSDHSTTQYIGFGLGISISNNTVFVGAENLPSPNLNRHGTYIYEKPALGWINTTETVKIITNDLLLFGHEIEANNNYFFVSGRRWSYVQGYNKTSATWAGSLNSFQIPNPSGNLYGRQLSLTDQHLVVSEPGNDSDGENARENIWDFYEPTNDWQNVVTSNQTLTQATITATDDLFGSEAVVYENMLIVGAPRDDQKHSGAGAVYFFDVNDPPGTIPTKLFAPVPQGGAAFGANVAVGDERLFVAAPFEDSLKANGTAAFFSIGKVYIYQKTGGIWTYHSQVVAPQISSNVNFGQKVVYHNGYLAVTEFYFGAGSSKGKVHIYKENAFGKYLYIATLTHADNLTFDFFGQSILFTDTHIFVGTGNVERSTSYQMKVFIYEKKGEWASATEDARLLPSQKRFSDLFGYSLAMVDDYVFVGAPGYPGSPFLFPQPGQPFARGSVYLFKKPSSGWHGTISEFAQLLPSDGENQGYFGHSIAIDQDDVFVGAPHSIGFANFAGSVTNNDGSIKPGKVYHFTKPAGDWGDSNQESDQFSSPIATWLDGFGSGLTLADRQLYVSAVLASTDAGFNSGAIFTTELAPTLQPLDPLCNDAAVVQLRGFPLGGTWSGNGVNTGGDFDPKIAGAGIHPITYSVNECEVEQPVEVVVNDLVITSQSDVQQRKCIEAQVEIVLESNASPSQLLWQYRASEAEAFMKLDSLKDRIFTKIPGFYSVEVRHPLCDSRLEYFEVENDVEVQITIEPTPVACATDKITLEAYPTGGVWTGQSVTTGGVFDPSNLENGIYNVSYSYQTDFGCPFTSEAQVEVDILDYPEVSKAGEKLCEGSPVVLTVVGVDQSATIDWFNNNLELNEHSPLLQVSKAGDYYARVSKYSCVFETPNIEVEMIADSIFVPNVFTPNGDAFNSTFKISAEGLQNFNLFVVNRTGKEVFHSNDPNFNWDGGDSPTGTYFWHVYYTTCSGDTQEHKGWVSLVR